MILAREIEGGGRKRRKDWAGGIVGDISEGNRKWTRGDEWSSLN